MPDAKPTRGLAGAASELLRQAGASATGFPTGYSVDDHCGKQRPGELALLWARAGIGKSTLVMNVLARSPQVPTAVFTLEMPPFRLFEWLLPMVNELPIDQRDIEHVLAEGTSNKHYHAVAKAMADTGDAFPLLSITQLSRPGVPDLVRACDDIYDATGVAVERVFIDHLTLMQGCAGSKEAIEKTTAELKAWTTRDEIGVLVIQQTGRAGGADGVRNDGHIPVTLSSGIYGGESDADWIFGAYRPDKDPKFSSETHRATDAYQQVRNVTRLQVVKNRPYGTLLERGIDLVFQDKNRRLIERGESWTPPMEGQ